MFAAVVFDALVLLWLGSGWPDTYHADGKTLRLGVDCAALRRAGTISKVPSCPLVLGNNYFIFCSSPWACPEPWREAAFDPPNADTAVSGRSCSKEGAER